MLRDLILKAGWEENEPGRAEKARVSRKRFMLEKMIRQGHNLCEEDKQFLNEHTEVSENAYL